MTLPELVCLAVLTTIGKEGKPVTEIRVGPSRWNALRVCPEVSRVFVFGGPSVGSVAGIPIAVDSKLGNQIGCIT